MDDETQRINKFLAAAGLGSRRSCEALVTDGRVSVNGEPATSLATRVGINDRVSVDGRRVYPARSTVLILLNKPQRYLTANRDDSDRDLAIDLVRPLYGGHIFPIGRLDFLSSGLLIYTNDGDLAERLLHPRYQVEREYLVETGQPIPEEILQRFTEGVTVEGERYAAKEYQVLSGRRVRLVLSEGKNREIRRVLQSFKVKIKRVHRTRYGPISLGKLGPGQARPLSIAEVTALYKSVALPLPTLHGSHSKRGGAHGSRN